MKNLPLRLAMRVEGANWNAYAARSDTMVNAIFLGSINMTFIETNEVRKKAFLALMQDAMGDVLEELFGERPIWNEPIGAPEHERTKE
jgi:hypothetical protein